MIGYILAIYFLIGLTIAAWIFGAQFDCWEKPPTFSASLRILSIVLLWLPIALYFTWQIIKFADAQEKKKELLENPKFKKVDE